MPNPVLPRPKDPQTLIWLETSEGYLGIVLDDEMICVELDGVRAPLWERSLAGRRSRVQDGYEKGL